jgi:hypothetical protein
MVAVSSGRSQFPYFDIRRSERVQPACYIHTDVSAEHAVNQKLTESWPQSELTLSVAALRHTARVVAAASVKARCLMNALWQLSCACPECKLCLGFVHVNTLRLEGFL